jgi:hypothetical protein
MYVETDRRDETMRGAPSAMMRMRLKFFFFVVVAVVDY